MEEIKRKPSEERVWEKYYPEEALEFSYPKMKTYDLVYEMNKNRKDHTALEYEGREISYGEFFDRVDERTDFFRSKGVKENEVVTVSMLMCPEFVYDWYALGRLNAVSNLIDPRTSADGIQKYLEEAESRIILNTNIFAPKVLKAMGKEGDYHLYNYSLRDSAKKMPFLLGAISGIMELYSGAKASHDSRVENIHTPEIIKVTKNGEVPAYQASQALTIVHTGGTTGLPKGVVLSHDNYNAMAFEYMKSQIGFAPDDRFLLIMPPWISYGSGMLHMSLVTGMKATIISKLESKKMAEYIMKYHPQWFAGVPAHYKIVSASKKLAKEGMPYLKAGAVGGDAMSAELFGEVDTFLTDNGASKGVYPGYALTEVTSAFAVRQLGDYKPGSVGIPLPGGTVGIFKFDEETSETLDEELDYNQTGEICMRTPNQMLGYFKHEELNEAVLKKHKDGQVWVHTGDLGYIDEDGFLYVNGRIKEMITRHDGFKVYPSAIEKVINAHKAVASCKVVGVDDTVHQQGQVPKAYIVLKPEYETKGQQVLKEIKSQCNYCLPEYYVEGCEYEAIEKLPLTPLGKVDFRALQEMSKAKTLKKRK